MLILMIIIIKLYYVDYLSFMRGNRCFYLSFMKMFDEMLLFNVIIVIEVDKCVYINFLFGYNCDYDVMHYFVSRDTCRFYKMRE